MCDSSAPTRANDVLAGYKARVNDLQIQIAGLRTRKRWALAVILNGVLLFGALLLLAFHGTAFFSAAQAIPLVGLVWAVAWRNFLRSRAKSIDLARRAALYERGIDRMEDNWRGKGNSGEDFARANHIYQSDLDILGEGSLFELLATTRSEVGAERLACLLLDSPTLAEARARQEAVKELRGSTGLREEIALLGKYQFQNTSVNLLRDWLSLPTIRVSRMVPLLLWICAAACLSFGAMGYIGVLPWNRAALPLVPLLALQAGIALVLKRRIRPQAKAIRPLTYDFIVLRQGLALMERQDFHCEKLRVLVERVRRGSGTARIRKLERLVKAIEASEDYFLYGFSLWLAIGTQLVLAIERWRAAHQREFEGWLDAWAEFEALNALACYAHEHPDNIFPELLEGEARFEAEDLAHPLLPRNGCVGNDIALHRRPAFYLISGSNMAGKSTFLRAIGMNAILAAAGAPVRASSARLTVFKVCASISIVDSLQEGKSKFLAEVERLRETIRSTADGRPVLFLIDEILSGTNSRDRGIAARSVVQALVAAGAVGALSTHDLALTEIAEVPRLGGANVHMQNEDPEQPLKFDYRVKPGIAKQDNAQAIVRMMGILA
jgi:hypothetical protein